MFARWNTERGRRGEATISEDQILTRIHEMGYITLKPIEVNPSYYELTDGTIIEAGIRIEAVVPDPTQPNGYNVRTSNYAVTYVPRNARTPERYRPLTSAAELATGIVEEDVENRILKEEFSSYALSNGMTLSIKAVVAQIQKTRFFTEQGEPIYSVQISPVYKFKKGS